MTKKGAKAIRKGARLDRAESEQDVVRKIGEDGWYTSLHQAASAEISAEKDQSTQMLQQGQRKRVRNATKAAIAALVPQRKTASPWRWHPSCGTARVMRLCARPPSVMAILT